jgi:ATP-binding cassette subfamily C protein CydCD
VSWAGATAQRAGRVNGVDLGVLVFLALGVAGMLQGLPDAVSRLQVSLASLERLARLGRVRAPVAAVDASDDGHQQAALALAATPASGCVPSSRREAIIALRDASIAHPDGSGPGQCPLIQDLNLDLLPGRPVALAGPSGSGKTSVVFALLRFIDLSAGRLIIDGADALAMPPERFRELMAWSPERPTLFPVTLRANLRVGAPHATDREITEVLVRLGLGPWLEQLEAGLDTVIASWGHPVSGGELQRLSVARALLADRPVLLLDEPTCHLDPDTAAAVTGAVLELAADRSLLWVTHRPEELRQFPDVCRLNPAAVSSH